MADYYTQSVLNQDIPKDDILPLTKYLLDHIFQSDVLADEKIYFYQRETACPEITVEAEIYERLRQESEKLENGIARYYTITPKEIIVKDGCDDKLVIVFDEDMVRDLFRDILIRSKTLERIDIISAFTCSKMRRDGFGGQVVSISMRNYHTMSTWNALEAAI